MLINYFTLAQHKIFCNNLIIEIYFSVASYFIACLQWLKSEEELGHQNFFATNWRVKVTRSTLWSKKPVLFF